MNEILLNGFAGMIGGLARASVGLLKSLSRKEKFRPFYFLMTMALASIIGLFMGLINLGDYRTSLVAGYAGSDILEGAYHAAKNVNAKQ